MLTVTESLTSALYSQLKYHEGLVLKVYRDSRQILTVGIGHNLEANPSLPILGRILREGDPITEVEAMRLFNEDISKVINQLNDHLPKSATLSQNRQCVLIDMVFNLGIGGFLNFKRMLMAINEGNFAKAADEMLNSSWAKQVKQRSTRLALMMRQDLSFEDACRQIK